jgi:hypothetical protein
MGGKMSAKLKTYVRMVNILQSLDTACKHDLEELKGRYAMQLYCEELTVENCLKVLDMAYKYDLRGLREKCTMQLSSDTLSVENCLKVLDMAYL